MYFFLKMAKFQKVFEYHKKNVEFSSIKVRLTCQTFYRDQKLN